METWRACEENKWLLIVYKTVEGKGWEVSSNCQKLFSKYHLSLFRHQVFHGGGIAGVGSHQYIHNTPADYRLLYSKNSHMSKEIFNLGQKGSYIFGVYWEFTLFRFLDRFLIFLRGKYACCLSNNSPVCVVPSLCIRNTYWGRHFDKLLIVSSVNIRVLLSLLLFFFGFPNKKLFQFLGSSNSYIMGLLNATGS